MKRNKQEEKLKQLRRINESYNNRSYREYEWVPVDEPQFIGYDVRLFLNATRRDDYIINEILDVFNARRPEFFRDIEQLSYIRKYKTYGGVLEAWSNRKRSRGLSWTPHIFNRLSGNIGEVKYNGLSERAKNYFAVEVKHSWSGIPYNEYHLIRWPSRFPFYAIAYKLIKAYSTHRGIPLGEEWAKNDAERDILYNNHYWCAKNGYSKWSGRRTWTGKRANRDYRKSWNQQLSIISKHYDGTIEFVEELETKLAPKVKMPWD